MIFAETMGKFSDAAERSEDMLTSTAFGLLRYIDSETGFLPILRRARRIMLGSRGTQVLPDSTWLPISETRDVQVAFWPSLSPYGVPDIILSLLDDRNVLNGAILVEVKLYSPKSSSAIDEEVVEDQLVADPDQLVKYWQGLCDRYRALPLDRLAILYLTAHPTPPIGELYASLVRRRDIRLGWLSWEDVYLGIASSHDLPAQDLVQLLEYKGFRPFSGFHQSLTPFDPGGKFWQGGNSLARHHSSISVPNKSEGWFELSAPAILGTRFWRAR